jgi:hypothetical protein
MLRVEGQGRARLALRTSFLGAAVLVLGLASAQAGSIATSYILRVEATTTAGTATWELAPGDPGVSFDGVTDTWTWNSAGPEELKINPFDPDPILTLDSAFLTFVGDPAAAGWGRIFFGYALHADAELVDVTVESGVLDLGITIGGPGIASGSSTLTESNGDTATLDAVGGLSGDSLYTASYNLQSAPVQFAELMGDLFQPEANKSISQTDNTGAPLATGLVSDMQAQFDFELTAFDQASGDSNYVVMPEPGSAILLLGGIVIGLLRRR